MGTKSRKNRAGQIATPVNPRKSNVKKVSGDKAKLSKLQQLKNVTKEIEERFKVSEKLFDKKRKLKQQLGIDPDF